MVHIYKRYESKMIELWDEDIERLDDTLPKKLLECFPEGYRFV